MRDVPSIDVPCGYVPNHVVDEECVDQVETCLCSDLLVFDGALQCRECGTVYGLVYGYNRYPRRRFRHARQG